MFSCCSKICSFSNFKLTDSMVPCCRSKSLNCSPKLLYNRNTVDIQNKQAMARRISEHNDKKRPPFDPHILMTSGVAFTLFFSWAVMYRRILRIECKKRAESNGRCGKRPTGDCNHFLQVRTAQTPETFCVRQPISYHSFEYENHGYPCWGTAPKHIPLKSFKFKCLPIGSIIIDRLLRFFRRWCRLCGLGRGFKRWLLGRGFNCWLAQRCRWRNTNLRICLL